MNAIEQKQHRIVTLGLEQRLDAIEPVVAAIDQRVTKAVASLDTRIHEERTQRLTLAQEQRRYVDNEDRLLRQTCDDRWKANGDAHFSFRVWQDRFDDLTFWGRLRWLLTGRVSL